MSTTTIAEVLPRRVRNSRGRATVEVEIITKGGATGRAIAPAGASTGADEAFDPCAGGDAFGGMDVQTAPCGPALPDRAGCLWGRS